MGRIILSAADGSQGRIISDDGREFAGPIPPNDGEALAVYDGLCAAGAATEPYVVPPAAPRQANGRQLRYALNRLGFRSAWDASVAGRVAAGKPDDADYWHTLGSADTAPETSPKLARIAAACQPPVDLKALYDAALTLG